MQQMIIANRLSDGVVVFLARGDEWVTSIDAGVVIARSVEADRLLAAAKADEQRCIVIDPNLIEVVVEKGLPRPLAIREAIRAFGPTVRTDMTDAA